MKKKILSAMVLTFVAVLATLIGYDIGYSKAMDGMMQASECKPSWKWRQRW